MSKSNVRLVDATSPPQTPQRAELAEAIARHTAALDAVKRVSQAREQADEVVYRSHDGLRAAESALKEAQAGEAAYLAAVALGENPGVSVADAEAAVTQATNDLNVARRTRVALDERAQREAKEVERAKEALERCIGAVVKTEVNVGQLLAEAQAVQADLVARRIVLRRLFNDDLVAEQEQPAVRQFLLFEYHLPVGRGQAEYGNGHYDEHPANDPWKAALAALASDADAPLPS